MASLQRPRLRLPDRGNRPRDPDPRAARSEIGPVEHEAAVPLPPQPAQRARPRLRPNPSGGIVRRNGWGLWDRFGGLAWISANSGRLAFRTIRVSWNKFFWEVFHA